jgi:hypothetical protein
VREQAIRLLLIVWIKIAEELRDLIRSPVDRSELDLRTWQQVR